jgi:hypothetical protein
MPPGLHGGAKADASVVRAEDVEATVENWDIPYQGTALHFPL